MDKTISKTLAWILRHGADKVSLTYQYGGYLYVDELLKLKQFHSVTLEDIVRVVNTNNKKRFELCTNRENGRLQIRAVQGHSASIDGLELELITDPHLYPNVLHGTYYRNWCIIRTQGLKRMDRNHIHFAVGESGESAVVSGMRSNAEVVIKIDLAKAIEDGYKFYLSKNSVILTEGDSEGCLPPQYFKDVYRRNPYAKLPL